MFYYRKKYSARMSSRCMKSTSSIIASQINQLYVPKQDNMVVTVKIKNHVPYRISV